MKPRIPQTILRALIGAAALGSLAPQPARAQITDIYDFSLPSGALGGPYGSLTMSGSTLYGMESFGDLSGDGTNSGGIFSFDTSAPAGQQFTQLHNFFGATDGSQPQFGALTLVNGVLNGLTYALGPNSGSNGTLFSIGTDGQGFSVLYTFSPSTGNVPFGSVTAVGPVLFGLTSHGGTNNGGVFFSYYNSTYTPAYNFDATESPQGSLFYNYANGAFYGMTAGNAISTFGKVFSIAPDGSGFTDLHDFNGSDSSNGSNPQGNNVVVLGGKIYGMTTNGGANSLGTLFCMNLDGSNFQVVHSFGANNTDGQNPYGSLTLVGSDKLYGMTLGGGTDGDGVVFSLDLNTAQYSVVDNFTNLTGSAPAGDLLYDGASTLYGLTSAGGANGVGTIFSLEVTVPEPGAAALVGTVALAAVARRPRRK